MDENPYKSPEITDDNQSGNFSGIDRPIFVQFKWSVEDLLEAQGYNFRHNCRPAFRFALNCIFAFMLMGGAIICFKERGMPLAFGAGLVVAGVYWFAIRPFERRAMIRRQYSHRLDKGTGIDWEIRSQTLAVHSAISRSEFAWEALIKVVRTPSGIMLYPVANIFHFLPRRGFESDAEFERLAELAKCKVQRCYDVV